MATAGVLNYIINVNSSSAVQGFHQVGASISNLKSEVMGLAATFGLLKLGNEVKDLLKDAAVAGFKFDQMVQDATVSFSTLLRSGSEAKKMIAELRAYADLTPFTFTDLKQASEMLLAFGMDGKTVMPTLKMLGDVSLGNSEKLQHLAYAYSEVLSQGQLYSRHILMMVNSGFNPLQVLSEKTGMTVQELKKLTEEGKISAELVTEAFKIATSEGGRFFEGMLKASQTFSGLMSTIRDRVQSVLGGVMAGVFNKVATQILPKVIDVLKNIVAYLPEISTAIETNVLPAVEKLLKTFMYFVGLYSTPSDTDSMSDTIDRWATGLTSMVESTRIILSGVSNMGSMIKIAADALVMAGTTLMLVHSYLSKGNNLNNGDPLTPQELAGRQIEFDTYKNMLSNLAKSMGESWDNIFTPPDLSKVDNLLNRMTIRFEGLSEHDQGFRKSVMSPKFTGPQGGNLGPLKTVEELLDMIKNGGKDAEKELEKFQDRVNSIGVEIGKQSDKFVNFEGLFERIERKGSSSGEVLLRRLKKHTEEMQKWADNMRSLEKRVGPGNEEFIDKIRQMGPEFNRQLKGLLKLSDSKLADAVSSYKEITKIGGEQAQAVIKHEHQGTIFVKSTIPKDQIDAVIKEVVYRMEMDLQRQSMYPGPNKLKS